MKLELFHLIKRLTARTRTLPAKKKHHLPETFRRFRAPSGLDNDGTMGPGQTDRDKQDRRVGL